MIEIKQFALHFLTFNKAALILSLHITNSINLNPLLLVIYFMASEIILVYVFSHKLK